MISYAYYNETVSTQKLDTVDTVCVFERQGFVGVCRSSEFDLFLQAPCRQISLRVPLQRKLGHVSSPREQPKKPYVPTLLSEWSWRCCLHTLEFLFPSEVSRTLIRLSPWTQDPHNKLNTGSALCMRSLKRTGQHGQLAVGLGPILITGSDYSFHRLPNFSIHVSYCFIIFQMSTFIFSSCIFILGGVCLVFSCSFHWIARSMRISMLLTEKGQCYWKSIHVSNMI